MPISAKDGFSRVCANFLESQTALRELGEFASVQVASWDKERPAVVSLAARRYPNAPEGEHLKAVELISAAIEDARPMRVRSKAADNEDDRVAAIQETSSRYRRLRSDLEELTGDPIAYYLYNRIWVDARMVPAKTDILLSSLLMAAVSDFENLIAGYVREYISAKPEILRESGASYSVSNVMAFDTIDAFQRHCAQDYAETAMHGGLEDWSAWFARKKIETASSFDLKSGLPEVFQRRHLLVHNAGVVNKFYISKLSGSDNLPEIGTRLRVDYEYFAEAIDALTLAAIRLAAALIRKLVKAEEGRHPVDELISQQMYYFLIQGRYRLAEEVGSLKSLCESENSRLVAQVNVWLCRKRLNGIETIRGEVETWNTTALHPRFELVRLALLDQRDRVLMLGAKLVKDGFLRADEWRDWPVLDEVRAYKESLVAADEILDDRENLYVRNPGGAVFHSANCHRAGLGATLVGRDERAKLRQGRCCAAEPRS